MLLEYGVPGPLLRAIQSLHERSESCVSIQKDKINRSEKRTATLKNRENIGRNKPKKKASMGSSSEESDAPILLSDTS